MTSSRIVGLAIGLIACASFMNLYIGLPVTLALILLTHKPIKTKRIRHAFFSILIYLMFISFAVLWKRGDDLLIIAPHIFFITCLTISFYLKARKNILAGFEDAMLIALIFDLVVNIATLVAFEDPFGRRLDIREDGLIRMNGIFGHPYLSVGISTVGGIIGIARKDKAILSMVLANMLINQTLRSGISLIVILCVWWILYLKNNRFLAYTIFTVFFSVSIYLATSLSDNPANQMRKHAWVNSIEVILEHPIFGSDGFERLNFTEVGVSADSLKANGITENFYLDIAMHFGVPLALSLLILLLSIARKVLDSETTNRSEKKVVMLLLIIITDSFYGNLTTNALLSVYLVVCLMDRNVSLFSMPLKNINPGHYRPVRCSVTQG